MNYEDIEHFPLSENLVKVIMKKTQNINPLYFRVLVAFYYSVIASMMRVDIKTHDRGTIPINMYAINLASSGFGKTYSANIIEEQVIHKFKDKFLHETFLAIAEKNVAKIANQRAIKYGEDPDEVLEKTAKEFNSLGTLAFSFDSGTSPAVKQMRHKLLMANAGSINLIIDEIGSNLLGNTDVLNTFLELYDVGKIKQKLTKNTKDNTRHEEIDGRTPTNMMLYGVPSKLLNGSKIEEEFTSFLETGYARRCLFGFAKKVEKTKTISVEEVYDMLTDTTSETFLEDLSNRIGQLADMVNMYRTLTMSKEVTLLYLQYKMDCEALADKLNDFEELRKAEISNRYYKALKIAGGFAFINGDREIKKDILLSAIKLVEESGKAFESILSRERNYVKLARYIANIGREVTQVDLVEDLGFYKGSDSQKKEMMALAIAYGYKNNIVIKRTWSDGIEFISGESIPENDLSAIITSYSDDYTTGYEGVEVPWDKLYKLVTADGYHYTAHHFMEGYRDTKHLIPGFNLVIIDVDKGISIELAKSLLKDYTWLIATTKRHTDEANRFRIILPISHTVKLNAVNYSKFMANVFKWLPFTVDEAGKDCARKWQSYPTEYWYNAGELLDAMLFIPETKKEEKQSRSIIDMGNLSNLERWFLSRTDSGNRNNQLIKYAFVLVDAGLEFESIRNKVMNFNDSLKDPLNELEIDKSIMVSVMKKLSEKI